METNLAVTTAERKERLIALRKRKQASEQGNGANGSGPSHFTFKQRNFDPETRQSRLRDKGDTGEDTVEKAVEGLAEQIIKEDEEKRKEELDLFNIQPRRANWDLKRDMTNRMAKLERKTNEAISTIFSGPGSLVLERLTDAESGQRLQSMKKDKDPAAEVDIVASMNAAENEREAADAAASSEED